MKGALLVNLGTPQAPTASAVGTYLAEFLADPRVVDLPRWLWIPLLRLVIVPLRRRRSAEAYKRVWTDRGSPLMTGSQDLCARVNEALPDVEVMLAMRYGQPSTMSVLSKLKEKGITELVLLPMYPQFSDTTTRSVIEEVERCLKELDWFPRLLTIENYYKDQDWIESISSSIRDFQHHHGKPERLLFSLHGIPQRYADNGDPYLVECEESVDLIASHMGLGDDYQLAFQSRVGREPWLQPYTDKTLEKWASEGVKSVQVVCPGFSIDCLETLEEIAMENCELFEEGGGESLKYIPSLNDSEAHTRLYCKLIEQALARD